MSSSADNRSHPRAPLKRPVRIHHADLGEFLEAHSSNISVKGMFLGTSSPLPAGSRFGFRFTVEDDVTVISGTAEVVWVRQHELTPDEPAGMGVRFVELDTLSRAIIERVVDLHVQRDGGEPFRLGDDPEPFQVD